MTVLFLSLGGRLRLEKNGGILLVFVSAYSQPVAAGWLSAIEKRASGMRKDRAWKSSL